MLFDLSYTILLVTKHVLIEIVRIKIYYESPCYISYSRNNLTNGYNGGVDE